MNFREDFLQQAGLLHEVKAKPTAWMLQDLHHFLANAFGRDNLNVRRECLDGACGLRLDLKPKPGGKAYGPQEPEFVFFKAFEGVSNGPNNACFKVILAAHVVNNLAR